MSLGGIRVLLYDGLLVLDMPIEYSIIGTEKTYEELSFIVS